MSTPQTNYTIPIRYRKMENSHIVFWVFKDISWCLGTEFTFFKYLGVTMIVPTLIISIIIMLRTKNIVSEFCHNLAITVWIMANSFWMVSEFFHFDSAIVFGTVTYKHLAMIPFSIGVVALAYYYLWHKPRHKNIEGTL